MTSISSFVVAYLLNALWEVPLLVLAVEMSTRILRGMRAAVIHRIWVGCLFLAIMLPAVSFLQPSALQPSTLGFGTMILAIPSISGAPSFITERVNKRSSVNTDQDDRSSRPGYDQNLRFQGRGLTPNSICLLYLASLLFPVSKLARSLVSARNLLRTVKPVLLEPDLEKAWKTCLATFELTDVTLSSSFRLSSPATLTWLKPVVILPHDLQGAGVDEMVAAFCHELAHVRRGDFVLNLLYEAAATLLFFHPALHWILRRLGEARELACDDLAADAMTGRPIYAKNLLLLAQRMSPSATRFTCALGVFETQLMEKRVTNLIGKNPSLQGCMLVPPFSSPQSS